MTSEPFETAQEVQPRIAEATRLRWLQIAKQREALDKEMQREMQAVFETLGLEGQWAADLATGELRRVEQPAPPTVLPNRQERRARPQKG